MNKTVLKKLTENNHHTIATSLYGADARKAGTPVAATTQGVDMLDGRDILKEAAKDLLQPRPEAIARLLKLAKDI